MIHIKTFEQYNISDVKYHRRGRDYYFNTDKWSYKVGISDNVNDPSYPFMGFRAKGLDDPDFNYDMSVVTNDNVFKVMDTISQILSDDYSKHNNKGYKFSFSGDKNKSNQRLELYKRFLPNEWMINYDDGVNQYYLTKTYIKENNDSKIENIIIEDKLPEELINIQDSIINYIDDTKEYITFNKTLLNDDIPLYTTQKTVDNQYVKKLTNNDLYNSSDIVIAIDDKEKYWLIDGHHRYTYDKNHNKKSNVVIIDKSLRNEIDLLFYNTDEDI